MRLNTRLLTALENCIGVRLYGLASFQQPDSSFNLHEYHILPNGMRLAITTSCTVKVGASTLVNATSGQVQIALRNLCKHDWAGSSVELEEPVPMAVSLLALASKQDLSWGTAEFNRSDCTMTVSAMYGHPTRSDRLIIQLAMTLITRKHFEFYRMSAADVEFILTQPNERWMEPISALPVTCDMNGRHAGV